MGISGGEYGVRGYLTAYDLNTGKLVWRAYNVGPDADILFDPAKTIDGATQQPVGQNSSLKTWTGDEWKLGGGTTWGWYTYDPQLNLVLLRHRQSRNVESRRSGRATTSGPRPSSPESGYRDGGVGVSDDPSRRVGLRRHQRKRAHRQPSSTARPFRPSRISIATAFPTCSIAATASCSRRHKFDPSTNWAKEIDLKTGRPVLDPDKMTKEDVNVKDICPAAQGAKNHQPASYDPKTKLFYVGTNHICMDYQAFSVKYKGGFPYVGATREHVPRRPRRCSREAHRVRFGVGRDQVGRQ